ncbi:MAG: hypothetical protein HY678_04315 [Chloroflexi bacterium]|nr:hypothetical protein [Chloroflexota bacterium]
MPVLNEEVRKILDTSFYIRATVVRKNGQPRTVEMTYYWSGGDGLVFSGYPGKRDWVASMARRPELTIHTVEGDSWWDIPARARVIRNRKERLPYILKYIERWARRPGYPRWQIQLFLGAVRCNRALRLPWWGPFALARRVLDRMPCVEISFIGDPKARPGGPPALSEEREGRP